MPVKRKGKLTSQRPSPRRGPVATKSEPKFVGRDPSPVLVKYPPKESGLGARLPPQPSRPMARPPAPPAAAPRPGVAPTPKPLATPGTAASPPTTPPSAAPAAPKMLISLERPFDIDEFSQLLGETVVRTEVPREDLAEALRRVSDFMGFGIYVYSVRVKPAKDETLMRFVVELQRVDYDPNVGDWVPFEETGRSDSPFGPTGGRR
ncbi:MAG: hypothetical protein L3K16_07010 [Thermoplasmata archaeon]|nr:hypothetical protein [Thermoplasmata archaeon]